jgi:hypothetical protein
MNLLVTYGGYMTRRKWKLTGEEPDIDESGDDFDDQGHRRRSLLTELAKDPTAKLVEIAPGVYHGPKPV